MGNNCICIQYLANIVHLAVAGMFYKPKIIEFFAGSGLVRHGLGLWYETVWANDICEKKAAIYRANFGKQEFRVAPIEQMSFAQTVSPTSRRFTWQT